MNGIRIWILVIAVGSVPSAAFAQIGQRLLPERWLERETSERGEERERIETDRHDFTQSPTVVGKGVAQIESGYSYWRKKDQGETEEAHTAPELMLRYGLTEDIEFRLRYNEVWQYGETENRNGSEDLRWAFKARLNDQRRWIPESALELRFTVPTGGDDWSTDKVEFGLDYIYGWRFNERLELYGSSGFSTNALGEYAFAPDAPADEEFMVYTQSIALGMELTEKSTLYTEFFGLFTDGLEDDEESPVFFNIGVDYYFTDDFVFDVRVGHGLNDDAEDFFCGVGGGFRF